MYSSLVFILTLVQWLIIGGSYFMQAHLVFSTAVVYGSPFFLMMSLLGVDSALIDSNPIYIVILIYHILKYFLFFRAQMIEDSNSRLTMAIMMEGAYLALSGYYLN